MYKCRHCEAVFDESDAGRKQICWEDYYGVGSMFEDRHYGEVMICPACGSEEIEAYCEECENEENYD